MKKKRKKSTSFKAMNSFSPLEKESSEQRREVVLFQPYPLFQLYPEEGGGNWLESVQYGV